MTAAARVVVLGDVMDDVLVLPESEGSHPGPLEVAARIERIPGGAGANTAAWLASEGLEVDFVGTVGRGDRVRHAQALEASGVRARLAEADGCTGTVVYLVDAEPARGFVDRGANAATRPAAVGRESLSGARHLHVSGYSVLSDSVPEHEWNELIDLAHSEGATVSADPGSAAALHRFGMRRFHRAVAGADVLVTGLDQALALAGSSDAQAAVETLRGLFPVVALTHGTEGAIVARSGGKVLEVLSLASADDLREATGWSDAFTAGFLAGWLEHPDGELSAAATRGMAAARSAVATTGGRPAPR